MVRISLTRRTMLRFSWADTGLLIFSWPRVTELRLLVVLGSPHQFPCLQAAQWGRDTITGFLSFLVACIRPLIMTGESRVWPWVISG